MLDSGLLHHDPDGFQQQLRRADAACRQEVQEELARHVQPPPAPSSQVGECRTDPRRPALAAGADPVGDGAPRDKEHLRGHQLQAIEPTKSKAVGTT